MDEDAAPPMGHSIRAEMGHSCRAPRLANRLGGADLALRRVEIDEGRDIAKYGKQMKAIGDQPSLTILREVTPMNAITIKSWAI